MRQSGETSLYSRHSDLQTCAQEQRWIMFQVQTRRDFRTVQNLRKKGIYILLKQASFLTLPVLVFARVLSGCQSTFREIPSQLGFIIQTLILYFIFYYYVGKNNSDKKSKQG